MARSLKYIISSALNTSKYLGGKNLRTTLMWKEILTRQEQLSKSWILHGNFPKNFITEIDSKFFKSSLSCGILGTSVGIILKQFGKDGCVLDGEKDVVHNIVLAQLSMNVSCTLKF